MIFKDNSNKKKKDLCEAATKIQMIMKNGDYVIKKWINSTNENILVLCPKDEQPWKGVFIQNFNE